MKVEYPKMIYKSKDEYTIVNSEEEKESFNKLGWFSTLQECVDAQEGKKPKKSVKEEVKPEVEDAVEAKDETDEKVKREPKKRGRKPKES